MRKNFNNYLPLKHASSADGVFSPAPRTRHPGIFEDRDKAQDLITWTRPPEDPECETWPSRHKSGSSLAKQVQLETARGFRKELQTEYIPIPYKENNTYREPKEVGWF
jgi:hypothetical protein